MLNPKQFYPKLRFQHTKEHDWSDESKMVHTLRAYNGNDYLGYMEWGGAFEAPDTEGSITSIEVHPEHQRKGVATALWNEGHRIARIFSDPRTYPDPRDRVPAPAHSAGRTRAGEAWSRTTSGYFEPHEIL